MSLYKNLSDDMLAGFFVEINKNIEEGILSEAMQYEIRLILKEAKKRKLSKFELKKIYQEKILMANKKDTTTDINRNVKDTLII
ncbi:hypothetical protein BTT_61510 (plasmid) [Bacillus thuringiensis serovar morrisoni str. 4AA1]|uniref:hypothetical protein n=1 Tax=Bacillus TaxID=1386 RepID=UPI0005CDDCB6|nr:MULTISPECIES: hypothetical protein [Bacillus]MED3102556.1 hypothetical protein [Bacillus thuringiensis]MRA99477.1 hypothetical protein [Bacillus thuringiensis]OTY42698.1 hypothetical protein BK736_09210 [Bacillus thuringiensis serovar poloniensis]RNG22275.1 hypothetical protein EEL55_29695 [Bacillus thuringiensis]RUR59929.1 hypothetical protein ELS81_29060 [Bacillus sp. VKPM B-3276]